MVNTDAGGKGRDGVMDMVKEGKGLIGQMTKLIQGEREKKRVAQATCGEMEGIKERIIEVFEGLAEENTRLRGMYEENRRCMEEVLRAVSEGSRGRSETVVGKGAGNEGGANHKETGGKNMKSGNIPVVMLKDIGKKGEKRVDRERKDEKKVGKEGKEGKGVEVIVKEKGKESKGMEKKEESRERNAEEREDGRAKNYDDRGEIGESQKEDGFTIVERKKNVGNKGKVLGVEKKALESWREVAPPESFVIKAGEGKAEEVKKEIWAEIVKRIGTPRVKRSWVNREGNLRLLPGDQRTAETLREIQREGKIGVREVEKNWPKVMIYDIDREMEQGEIPGVIGMLNPELGIEKGKEGEAIMPIFRRGPREEKAIGWVCVVKPEVHRKMTGRYIYVGMALCKVKDFVDLVQCRRCQGFGHLAAKCRKEEVCAYCAEEGHGHKKCGKKGEAPKCINCGKRAWAEHKDCKERRSEIRRVMVGTDYAAER